MALVVAMYWPLLTSNIMASDVVISTQQRQCCRLAGETNLSVSVDFFDFAEAVITLVGSTKLQNPQKKDVTLLTVKSLV